MALIRQQPSNGAARPALVDGDAWVAVDGSAPIDDAADVIVPLARLGAEASAILSRRGRTGVRLPNDRGLEPVLPFLPRLALIAIEFPKHVDGRGYSLARLLRERHGFTGELRAVGNVLRDNLLFMQRCGFDAFELDPKYGPGGIDPRSALAAFDELDVFYQAASDVRLPLWKRVDRA
jgi:uncharacterized protein (DUF934 family)